MISFRDERVVSFALTHQDVYWEIEPTNEDLQEYHFIVERSESEGGPFAAITGPLIDRYYIRDNNFPSLTVNRQFFYRIRAVHVPSSKEKFSKVFDRRGEHTLEALEIIRNEQVLFQEFVGTRCWLFPVRTFGQRCPNCYDAVLGKRLSDACTLCWGTGFSGGYHYPIEFWGQVDPHESSEQLSSQMHQQQVQKVLRMGPTPFAKPLDLIIDHLNLRLRVMTVGGSSRLGVPVRQELRLVAVEKGDVEGRIPLKIDEKSVILVPDRLYTNPHSLDQNRDVDFATILSAYGIT